MATVTTECLSKEIIYHASLAPFQEMLSEGLITAEDYAAIDTILHDKYRPIFGSNISENTLDIVPKQR